MACDKFGHTYFCDGNSWGEFNIMKGKRPITMIKVSIFLEAFCRNSRSTERPQLWLLSAKITDRHLLWHSRCKRWPHDWRHCDVGLWNWLVRTRAHWDCTRQRDKFRGFISYCLSLTSIGGHLWMVDHVVQGLRLWCRQVGFRLLLIVRFLFVFLFLLGGGWRLALRLTLLAFSLYLIFDWNIFMI